MEWQGLAGHVAPLPQLTLTPVCAPAHRPLLLLLQRDDAINAGFAWFREKGLIPATEDSSDDDVNYAEAAGVEW